MRGRWAWWAAAAVGVTGLVSALVVEPSVSGGGHRVDPRAEVRSELRDPLSERVVKALESDPAWNAELGGSAGMRSYCGADVFGIEPSRARTVAEITSVYAWVDCEWRAPTAKPVARKPEAVKPSASTAGSRGASKPAGPPAIAVAPSGASTAEADPPAGRSGAVVVHFDPTRWQLPADGAAHAPSVRRLFPRDLWHHALQGGLSSGLAADRLEDRLRLIGS